MWLDPGVECRQMMGLPFLPLVRFPLLCPFSERLISSGGRTAANILSSQQIQKKKTKTKTYSSHNSSRKRYPLSRMRGKNRAGTEPENTRAGGKTNWAVPVNYFEARKSGKELSYCVFLFLFHFIPLHLNFSLTSLFGPPKSQEVGGQDSILLGGNEWDTVVIMVIVGVGKGTWLFQLLLFITNPFVQEESESNFSCIGASALCLLHHCISSTP